MDDPSKGSTGVPIVMRSNYALERSVRALSERAAGAPEEFAPAARWPRVARPAQRGR